jgi:hypothetical protein
MIAGFSIISLLIIVLVVLVLKDHGAQGQIMA